MLSGIATPNSCWMTALRIRQELLAELEVFHRLIGEMATHVFC